MPERRALWKLLSDFMLPCWFPLSHTEYRVVLMDGVSRAAAILRSKERLLMRQISASITHDSRLRNLLFDVFSGFVCCRSLTSLQLKSTCLICQMLFQMLDVDAFNIIQQIKTRNYHNQMHLLAALPAHKTEINMVGWGRGDVWPKKLEKERRLKSGSSQLLFVQKTLYANSRKSLKTCWFETSFWNQKRYCPRSEAGIVWTTVGLFCEFWGFARLPWSQVERGWVIAGVALDKWARRDVDIHRSLLNFPGIPACSYQLWASIFHRFLMSCC